MRVPAEPQGLDLTGHATDIMWLQDICAAHQHA